MEGGTREVWSRGPGSVSSTAVVGQRRGRAPDGQARPRQGEGCWRCWRGEDQARALVGGDSPGLVWSGLVRVLATTPSMYLGTVPQAMYPSSYLGTLTSYVQYLVYGRIHMDNKKDMVRNSIAGFANSGEPHRVVAT
jgi:hypothetical protein